MDGTRPGPFVSGAAACGAWCEYSRLAGWDVVRRVNGAGAALYLAYAACYAVYAGAQARRALAKILATMAAALTVFFCYLRELSSSKWKQSFIGTVHVCV